MWLVVAYSLCKKEEELPDWHPNKQNLTFEQMMEKLNSNKTWEKRDENFRPTMYKDGEVPMLGKVKKEWLENPQEYRKQLEQVRIDGETKLNRSYIPSGSNSTDPMLRLNPFVRMGCKFKEIRGLCTITRIVRDPNHQSLRVVEFTFDKDAGKTYQMQHRYRNPYGYWVESHGLEQGQEHDCTKLELISGDYCSKLEWDFKKIDWN